MHTHFYLTEFVFFCFLGIFLFLLPTHLLQYYTLMVGAIVYMVLGISHHVYHRSINIKIMLEYIAIAVLGILISTLFFVSL